MEEGEGCEEKGGEKSRGKSGKGCGRREDVDEPSQTLRQIDALELRTIWFCKPIVIERISHQFGSMQINFQ